MWMCVGVAVRVLGVGAFIRFCVSGFLPPPLLHGTTVAVFLSRVIVTLIDVSNLHINLVRLGCCQTTGLVSEQSVTSTFTDPWSLIPRH